MQIVRVNSFQQPEMVQAIATIYRESFGGEPWNEGYICPVCGEIFPLSFSVRVCSMCQKKSRVVLVVEYWPISKIITDFYSEMMKPEPICLVAKIEDQLVGTAWGYRVFADNDLDIHLDAPNLHNIISGDFFYLDECAIRPFSQGKGLGKSLVGRILIEQNQKEVILRTLNESRMCNLIKHMGGEIIQQISRNRVIMKLVSSRI